MGTFQPLVNLLTPLGALSIASERLTNVAKLADDELKDPVDGVLKDEDKRRSSRTKRNGIWR